MRCTRRYVDAKLTCAYVVTYPTKYKQLRAAFPRSALGGAHATIRGDEGLAMEHELPRRFIRNANLVGLADCASACACCRFSS
jgi:hypothetical protein